ncbi:hypothetical protein ADUPG1_003719, partial [Aduncisulcus paluster]
MLSVRVFTNSISAFLPLGISSSETFLDDDQSFTTLLCVNFPNISSWGLVPV